MSLDKKIVAYAWKLAQSGQGPRQVLTVWNHVHDKSITPADKFPVDQAELEVAVRQFAAQFLERLGEGDAEAARTLWSAAGIYHIPWCLLGITQDELLAWLVAHAKGLFGRMVETDDPDIAEEILGLPPPVSWSLDRHLGPGAQKTTADMAVRWVHHTWDRLAREELTGFEAEKTAMHLHMFVDNWQHFEQSSGLLYQLPDDARISSRLDVGVEDTTAMLKRWFQANNRSSDEAG